MVLKILIILSMVRVPSTICLHEIKIHMMPKITYYIIQLKENQGYPVKSSLNVIFRVKVVLSLVGVAATIC